MAGFRNLDSGIQNLKRHSDSISKQLGGWIQALLNSGMKGQRYATDKVREGERKMAERDEFLKKLERIRRGEQP